MHIGQLAGYLDALNAGVTTVLDHFQAARTPAIADAYLAATIASRARARRAGAATAYLPHLAFGDEPAARAWRLAKLREWGTGGGRLTPDGRVLLGLG